MSQLTRRELLKRCPLKTRLLQTPSDAGPLQPSPAQPCAQTPPAPEPCPGLPPGRCTAPGPGPARDPAGARDFLPSFPPAAFLRALPPESTAANASAFSPGRRAQKPREAAAAPPPPAEPYLGCRCTCSRPAGWRQSRPSCRRRGAAAGERSRGAMRPPPRPGPAPRARFLPQAPPLARRRQKEVGPRRRGRSCGPCSPPLSLSSPLPAAPCPGGEPRGCPSPVSEIWEQKVAGGSGRSCGDVGEDVRLQGKRGVPRGTRVPDSSLWPIEMHCAAESSRPHVTCYPHLKICITLETYLDPLKFPWRLL